MIVVDTSALFSIIARENDADRFAAVIAAADRALIGAPTAFELRLIIMKKAGPAELMTADLLLGSAPIEVVGWDPGLVAVAADAFRRFGGRRASLNYGDCMAYALAKSLDAPLLYKGGDFAATDVRSAI